MSGQRSKDEGRRTMKHIALEDIDVYVAELPDDMPKREAERVAKEQLLSELLGKDCSLIYTSEGRPLLSDRHISISHSKTHLCVALSKTQEIGVDIEEIQPRLLRVKDRFLNPIEREEIGDDLALLAITWSAKEAIYKIAGAKAGAIGEHITLKSVNTKHFSAECCEKQYRLQVVELNEKYEIVLATKI